MANYVKSELARKVRGIGNSYALRHDEFCITNDDTHEIWKRNGQNMHEFKTWYLSINSSDIECKLTGSYPYYDYR